MKKSNGEFSAAEVAVAAHVSKDTLIRWEKAGKIAEPARDRNGYRVYTAEERDEIIAYAESIPPMKKKKAKRA
jgi:site-specific DNA-methyltransferase (cytosine-N4-specific)